MSKRKLCDNCDSTYESIQDNVEKAYDLFLPKCFNDKIWDTFVTAG